MPQAIAGIGVALAGAFSVTSAIGVFAIQVATFAVVGAAVGGLTAAVMGGDIGKGMLFGAIGGAVMGGIGLSTGMISNTATSGLSMASSAGHEAAIATGSSTGLGVIEGARGAATGGLLGMSQGSGTLASALVTTAGPMIAGAFSGEGDLTEKDVANDKLQRDLAKLQADTAVKVAGMRSSGGGSNGDARYAADLQLLNAREQRAQDYQMRKDEYSQLEEARSRRAGALQGMTAAKEAQAYDPSNPSVDEQVYKDSTEMYAQPAPAPAQEVLPSQGVLQEPK